MAGHLVIGHLVTRPGHELLAERSDVGAGPDHHEGAAHLTHALVGHADHRRLGHGGVAEQGALDLGRVGVEAADDEHVLLAVGDPHVAGVVHDPDVAGVEPAVGVDGLGRGLGVLEVARHHGVAPHHDLARLAARQLGALGVDDAHLEAGDGAPEVLAMVSGSSPRRHIVTVPVDSVSP